MMEIRRVQSRDLGPEQANRSLNTGSADSTDLRGTSHRRRRGRHRSGAEVCGTSCVSGAERLVSNLRWLGGFENFQVADRNFLAANRAARDAKRRCKSEDRHD